MTNPHPATPAGGPVRVSDTRAYISEQSPDADRRSRVAHLFVLPRTQPPIARWPSTERTYRPCACGEYQLPHGFVLRLDDLRAEVRGQAEGLEETHSTGGCFRPAQAVGE